MGGVDSADAVGMDIKSISQERLSVPNAPIRNQSESVDARVAISRAVFTKSVRRYQEKMKVDFSYVKERCHISLNKCCSVQTICHRLISLFPVLTWLPSYQWKSNLLPDFLAGLTVGIMSIPQGMAYSRLAGMPPVYGLYTNIIPTFMYFLLGTSKLAAIGPATVLSLIMSSIRYKHIPCEDCWLQQLNLTNFSDTNSMMNGHSVLTPIELGSAVAFLAGGFLILMGVFRLSFISDYLPDQLVGGFTMAAAIQVFAGQLPSIFGIKLPNRNGVGKVILNFIDLFTFISKTNLATLITFGVSFIFLEISKHLINPRFQPKLKLPFPGEFLVMVGATLASHFAHFNKNYGVSIVQHIEAGLPSPDLPKTSIMGMLLADSFVLAIVTYSYSISLAKLYAKRNGYRIQSTQEFYAYGAMNFVGSFFQCFNSGLSVARTMVYEMAGAKTQLCGMFGTLVVILTVLFVAPFLESLPNAALAAIIVAAIMETLKNLKELPNLFRKSKPDFIIYLVTFTAVVVLDVTYGLAVSVAFALITVVLRSQRTRVEITNEEAMMLYSSEKSPGEMDKIEYGKEENFWNSVKVMKLTSSLFYANAEKVKNCLLDECNIQTVSEDDTRLTRLIKGLPISDKDLPMILHARQPVPPAVVVLDMTSVAFMDLMGVNALKEVTQTLKAKGVSLYICGCTASVEKLLIRTQTLDIDDAIACPTVLDGLSHARYRLQQSPAQSMLTVIEQNGNHAPING